MGKSSHAPGFRFCPTDEELVMYYLKRKVMGKKFHSEVIAEVNIYRFSPWDLPDKSCLKTKDRIWYFFCPREKKYASGARVTRATENGYWKTTGKDRPVNHNAKKVGTIKTLVFHLGHAPHGERTDWVLHEYRILDDQLAAAGFQDTYVLCEIFKKNGPGPKNGEQYGAPFNEADWADDDTDDDQSHAISLTSDGPSATLLLNEEQICTPVTTGLLAPGKMSGMPLIEGPSISSDKVAGEVLVDETNDEIVRLLDPFTDDDMLHEFGGDQDDRRGEGKKSLPSSEEYNIYNGLGDIDSSALQMNEYIPGFSRMENDCSSLENTSLDNLAFIELDDLLTPLDCPIGFTENDQSSIDDIFRSYGYGNIQQSYSGAHSAQTSQLPNGTYAGDNHFVPHHMVNGSLNQGVSNASYDLGFELSQLDYGSDLAEDIPRGIHIKICLSRIMELIPAPSPSAALSYNCCGGSSIHIKAEVTHGAGECTKDALSVMMGGSSSCFCAFIHRFSLHLTTSLVDFGSLLFFNFFVLMNARFYHFGSLDDW